jgi:alpha-beta hydrolase superfamily lysophospholipase
VIEAVVRRTESHFRGFDGLGLFRRAWLPAEPRRILVVVHGYAEHSGRYEGFGSWFAAQGYAVHAYDHRGHGRSRGRRCHVGDFREYLDDLDGFLEIVREEHSESPMTLVGHSMGGLVTAAYLVDRRPAIESAITSGAGLALGPGIPRLRVAAARLLRRLLPRFRVGSGLDPNGLSRDPEVVKDYLEDPLVFRSMTASLAAELVSAVPRTAARAAEVAVPLLMLHGEDDPLCPADGSRAFFEGVAIAGSNLRIYPELRHEIFNEPEHERVYLDILDWLEGLAGSVNEEQGGHGQESTHPSG